MPYYNCKMAMTSEIATSPTSGTWGFILGLEYEGDYYGHAAIAPNAQTSISNR